MPANTSFNVCFNVRIITEAQSLIRIRHVFWFYTHMHTTPLSPHTPHPHPHTYTTPHSHPHILHPHPHTQYPASQSTHHEEQNKNLHARSQPYLQWGENCSFIWNSCPWLNFWTAITKCLLFTNTLLVLCLDVHASKHITGLVPRCPCFQTHYWSCA